MSQHPSTPRSCRVEERRPHPYLCEYLTELMPCSSLSPLLSRPPRRCVAYRRLCHSGKEEKLKKQREKGKLSSRQCKLNRLHFHSLKERDVASFFFLYLYCCLFLLFSWNVVLVDYQNGDVGHRGSETIQGWVLSLSLSYSLSVV